MINRTVTLCVSLVLVFLCFCAGNESIRADGIPEKKKNCYYVINEGGIPEWFCEEAPENTSGTGCGFFCE